MIAALVRWMVRWPLRWPRATLVASAVLTAVLGVFIPRLHISTDRTALSGKDNPAFVRREAVNRLFGTSLVSVVVLTGPDKGALRTAAQEVAARLQRRPDLVRHVFYRADVDFFERHALYYAPVDVVRQVVDVLAARPRLEALTQVGAVADLVALGTEHLPDAAAQGAEADPAQGKRVLAFATDLMTDVRDWFRAPAGQGRLGVLDALWRNASSWLGARTAGSPDGYLWNDDAKTPHVLVLFVQPARDDERMETVAPLTDFVRAQSRRVAARHPHMRALVTGMPSLQTDELRLVTRDTLVAGIVAALGVLLVFALAFRSARVGMFLVLPLGVGLVWAAGFTGLVYGRLTMITSYFAAVLFGLGVAFTLHIVARLHEALRAGQTVPDAVETAMVGAGPGVVVGGVTTAVAFGAIVFSEFAGFAEMGVVSGVGVLFVLAANLTLLPASLVLWHPGAGAVRTTGSWARGFAALTRSRVVPAVLGGALFAAGLWAASRVRFDYAVESMLPAGSEAVAAMRILDARTPFSSTYSVSVADSLDAARARSAAFSRLSTVARVESAALFVPSRQGEKQRLIAAVPADVRASVAKAAAALQRAARRPVDTDPGRLADALEELGYQVADLAFDAKRARRPEAKGLARLAARIEEAVAAVRGADRAQVAAFSTLVLGTLARGAAALAHSLAARPVDVEALPDALRRRFVSADGRKFAVIVYPNGDIGDKAFFFRHVRELLSVDPQATGHPVTHKVFTDMVQRGFVQAAALSAVAVLLLVVLDLRDRRSLALAVGPVLLSGGWTALLLWIAGFRLNYANVMAVPILIGTAVDYGVHLAHRAKQDGDVLFALCTTGRTIFLSGITTLIGFGSLVVGRHWGVQSLGLFLVVGIGFSLVAALVVMPALVRQR